jgi:hypothetical protein
MSSATRRNLPARSANIALLVAMVCNLVLPASSHAATPQQVDAAIQKGKKFLRSQQKPDGSWEPTGPPAPRDDQQGGNTAMATYALLAAGDSPQEEHIKKAVSWLMSAKITGIYALGLRCQVWPYLKRSDAVRAAVIRDADALLKSCDRSARWGYTTRGGNEHNSPTQYGVLGLWACDRAGFEVPTTFWKRSEKSWFDCQGSDGAWGYRSARPSMPKNAPTASMTLAGLASLFIAQDYVHANDGIRCNGNVTNPHIELGLKWLSENFDPNWSDGYVLYGIERTGVASGYKYFGSHDWYALGADTLVRTQRSDGSWPYSFASKADMPVPGTSFALFFLTRGRAPVAMNKLHYAFTPAKGEAAKGEAAKGQAKPATAAVKEANDGTANWNQRPRDVANVVRWLGAALERDLNWQVVNLSAKAIDLLDAPLLYMAGDQELRLSDADKQKLRSYVEQGGIILGQADCAKPEFAKSFKALGGELFPAYEFRTLPSNHFVFTEQYPASKWKGKIEVEGLSNGSRELMLLIPRDDVGKSWQLQVTTHKEHHFQLLSNIFLYAVDRADMRYKGDTYVITPDDSVTPRRTIKLARVRYAGNWDPEPGGWRRMAAYLLNNFELRLDVKVEKLGGEGVNPAHVAGSLNGYDVAHLTGTDALKLSAEARQELRRFVQVGGTLLVDAAGGNTAFADAAEQVLADVFKTLAPDAAVQLSRPAKPDSAVYTLPASKLAEAGYRSFARTQLGATRAPRLRIIRIKDRPAVFFSKEDLSTGLVGQSVDGIYGYDPATATQLTANVILLATGEGKSPPASKPATTRASTQPTSHPSPGKPPGAARPPGRRPPPPGAGSPGGPRRPPPDRELPGGPPPRGRPPGPPPR